MWPPIETLRPGNRNGNSEVDEDHRPEAGLHRVDAAGAQEHDAAPIRPNTAPDAPTV